MSIIIEGNQKLICILKIILLTTDDMPGKEESSVVVVDKIDFT